MTRLCVFQDWLFAQTMQQQSVLILACRGPDSIAKFHPTKLIVQRYRASVLKAAYLGRAMKIDEHDDTTYMSLERFSDAEHWNNIVCKQWFDHCDEVPHHYYMHLMHGAQIIGYKHNRLPFRQRWQTFYLKCCRDLHVEPESVTAMDNRLSDWHREHWDDPEPWIQS